MEEGNGRQQLDGTQKTKLGMDKNARKTLIEGLLAINEKRYSKKEQGNQNIATTGSDSGYYRARNWSG